MDFDVFRVASASAVFTVQITSSSFTLPAPQVAGAGTNGVSAGPRYVRILPEANCYVSFGQTAGAATSVAVTNGMLITPNMPEIVNVAGFTYMATIGRAVTMISVTPVET